MCRIVNKILNVLPFSFRKWYNIIVLLWIFERAVNAVPHITHNSAQVKLGGYHIGKGSYGKNNYKRRQTSSGSY